MSEHTHSGSFGRVISVVGHSDVHRLFGWLGGGVVFAIASSPEGRLGAPSYAITQAFHGAHLLKCLGGAVIGWLIYTLWSHRPASVRTGVSTAKSQTGKVVNQPQIKVGLYLALIIALIVIPPAVLSQYWMGVLVEQIGIYALL